jgi:uncharacterized protein YcfL
MRKLLFSASILVFVGCSSQKPETNHSENAQVEETKSENKPETKIEAHNGSVSETQEAEKVVPADEIKTETEVVSESSVKKEEPKHQSYDQSKIDSIKQAKQKGKK